MVCMLYDMICYDTKIWLITCINIRYGWISLKIFLIYQNIKCLF